MSYCVIISNLTDSAGVRGWERTEEWMNPNLHFEDVHVLLLSDDYDYASHNPFKTLMLHKLPNPLWIKTLRRAPVLGPVLFSFWVARHAASIIRKHGLGAAVYFYGNIWNNGIPAVLAGRWADVPSVVTMHNPYHQYSRTEPVYTKVPFVNDLLENWVYRRATKIRCVSRYLVDYVAERDVPQDRLVYIPNKIDLSEWDDVSTQEVERFVAKYSLQERRSGVIGLFAGRLNYQKNVVNMLKAFARAKLQHKDLQLLIAGHGPLREKLERLAEELRIDTSVRFLGRIPHSDLRSAYSLADFLLLPSWYEGQGRVLIEALATGTPVISTKYTAPREMILDDGWEKGVVVDPASVEEISGAILKMAADTKFRREVASNTRKGIEKYSWEYVGQQEVDLIKNVICRGDRVQQIK